ncbi:hypothetical protein Hanom_Chr03g00221411 [Helianthus anomalus]
MWNNRKYRIWVMEEQGNWVPEFVEAVHDQECNTDASSDTVPVNEMASPVLTPEKVNSINGETNKASINVEEDVVETPINSFNTLSQLNGSNGPEEISVIKSDKNGKPMEKGDMLGAGTACAIRKKSKGFVCNLSKKRKKFHFKRSGSGSGQSSGPQKKRKISPCLVVVMHLILLLLLDRWILGRFWPKLVCQTLIWPSIMVSRFRSLLGV